MGAQIIESLTGHCKALVFTLKALKSCVILILKDYFDCYVESRL